MLLGFCSYLQHLNLRESDLFGKVRFRLCAFQQLSGSVNVFALRDDC